MLLVHVEVATSFRHLHGFVDLVLTIASLYILR